MTDRLTNIVLGLQRLTEETQIRSKDIRHAQAWEDAEHLKYLNELLVMVQRMHSALIDDIREFSPSSQMSPSQGALNKNLEDQRAAINKVAMVQRGPGPA